MKTKKKTDTGRNMAAITAELHKNLIKANECFVAALQGVLDLSNIAKERAKEETPKRAAKRTAAAVQAPAPVKQPAVEAKPAPAEGKQPVRRRTPASVRLLPHEITLNIGSYPVKELAERDARELLNNPRVFWNRGTQFPDPKRYGVQPRVEHARVVERSDPKFTRSPWTVSLTIAVDGDDKKAESWGSGVYGKNKGDQE